MNLLDLFSGIGGFSSGLEKTGMRTVAFCEVDERCRRVLAKHWPDVPCYDDIKTLTKNRLQNDGISVDAICGGFPCQNISTAAAAHGGDNGLAGSKSGLWFEYARLIEEIRPKVVAIENVDRLAGNGLDGVLRSLAEIGYDAEWEVLPGYLVGAPQARKRMFVIAYPSGQRISGLFESVDFSKARQGWEGRPSNMLQYGQFAFIGRDSFPEPLLRGVDDRPADWMDRLHECGNAIIPLVAEIVGNAIATSRTEIRFPWQP